MADHAEYLARRSFGSLDGIRAIAILAVIWHHAAAHPPGLAARGFLGVDLFFVLSGFLIVTLLLRERARTGTIALGAFYVRRSLRIFPLYYALLAGLTVVFALKSSSANARAFFEALPFLATYTSNWVVLTPQLMSIAWSLACEEQFYLVWPFVERFLGRAWTLVWGALFGLSVVIAFGGISALDAHRGHLEVLDATFAPILLGVLLAHVLHAPSGFAALSRALGHRAAAPLALACVLAIAAIPAQDIRGSIRGGVWLAMTALIGAVAIREDHGLARLLTFAPLARIGVVSYGMYLLHQIGLHGARAAMPAVPALVFLAGTAITWAIAELSFRLFEARFMALKARFAR